MNVDTISSPGGVTQQSPKAAENIDSGRKNKESVASDPQAAAVDQKVQPEELLDQIKALTEDGQFSVRFEKDDKLSDMVIKIFNNDTKEVVRQIPAEELLNFKASFAELVGNLVDTKG